MRYNHNDECCFIRALFYYQITTTAISLKTRAQNEIELMVQLALCIFYMQISCSNIIFFNALDYHPYL